MGGSIPFEVALSKLAFVGAVLFAAAPTGVFESVLNDPFAPCVLGAVMGEVARALRPAETTTDHLFRRFLKTMIAVVFGALVAWYSWRVVPLAPPGLAKIICGVCGWVFVIGLSTLRFEDTAKALKKIAVDGIAAMVKGSKND